jgi:hypothetical protein
MLLHMHMSLQPVPVLVVRAVVMIVVITTRYLSVVEGDNAVIESSDSTGSINGLNCPRTFHLEPPHVHYHTSASRQKGDGRSCPSRH